MKKNKKITYTEIAKEAKVSLGTLSRYFNGAEISPVRAKRIEEVVNKYNYIKSFAAASIRSKSKLTVILRSRFSSFSQDNIIEGFVSLNGPDILIRYYNDKNIDQIIN
jgi:LacI family transcriptional regulator